MTVKIDKISGDGPIRFVCTAWRGDTLVGKAKITGSFAKVHEWIERVLNQ